MNEALLNPRLISDTISSFQELQLAAVLVAALLEFLRGKCHVLISHNMANALCKVERPSADASATYFSDGTRLGNRLIMILSVALETNEDATVVRDCYATILEASLHSRIIWEAFIEHPQVPQLHRALLLEDLREPLRQHVAQKIDSVCGGDLPSTCPLTKGEIATQFAEPQPELGAHQRRRGPGRRRRPGSRRARRRGGDRQIHRGHRREAAATIEPQASGVCRPRRDRPRGFWSHKAYIMLHTVIEVVQEASQYRRRDGEDIQEVHFHREVRRANRPKIERLCSDLLPFFIQQDTDSNQSVFCRSWPSYCTDTRVTHEARDVRSHACPSRRQ